MPKKVTVNMSAKGEVTSVDAAGQLKRNFLKYTLMVSRHRAIPDARDGLKPVHRRVIWGGNTAARTAKTIKSAKVVSETMGSYHPHGDMSIYNALVLLVQDFKARVPLFDGQGNFGAISGAPQAAMRYTETRLAEVTKEEFLNDAASDYLKDFRIDREDLLQHMVAFKPNYDESTVEPTVLPVSFPNLLVNGTEGIGVGFACAVPPHNLNEVCEAALVLLADPEATVDQIMRKIKGPDFPTGGIVVVDENFRAMYATGKGNYTALAKVEQQDEALMITEFLYSVDTDKTMVALAAIVDNQKVEGIVDVNDITDKTGQGIRIDLKKDADPEQVLRNLRAVASGHMRKRFVFDMIVIVDGEPRQLGVRQFLQYWIDFRSDVIRKRSAYIVEKFGEREHLLKGFKIALDNIDEVVKIIRTSKGGDVALNALMTNLKLTEVQARAVLDMQLRRLNALDRQQVLDDLKLIAIQIAFHKEVVAKKERQRELIKEDLERVIAKYGSPRRTQIINVDDEQVVMSSEMLVPDEDVVLTVNRSGFAKRYRADILAKRTGERDSQDQVTAVGTLNARDMMYLFTAQGRAYLLKAARFPQARSTEKGSALEALIQMEKGDAAVSMLDTKAKQYIFFTEKGEAKRVKAEDFVNANAGGIKVLELEKGDKIIGVFPCTDKSELAVVSKLGQVLRFAVSGVRVSQRGSGTVRAITLKKGGDNVVGAGVGTPESFLVTVTDSGFAKSTKLKDIPVQGRGTSGVRAMGFGERAKEISAAMLAEEGDFVLLSVKGEGDPKVIPLSKIIVQPRDRAGQRLLTACGGGVVWTGQALLKKEE